MNPLMLAVLATTPSFFLGTWVNQPGQCGQPYTAGHQMRVTPAGIENPGSTCPQTFNALDGDRYRMIALCQDARGEPGASMVEVWTLVQRDVLTTVNDMSTRPAITWSRCP